MYGTNTSSSLAIAPEKFHNFGANEFEEIVQKSVALPKIFGANVSSQLVQEISDFYLNTETEPSSHNYTFYLDKYTELRSDILFVEPVLIEAKLKASLGWPVYVYENVYYNPTMFAPDFPVKGLFILGFLLVMFGINFGYFSLIVEGDKYPIL